MKYNALMINSKDNVAVVIEDIHKGKDVVLPGGDTLNALSDIPYGHKIAIRDLKAGSSVMKYGEAIGKLKYDVLKGEWVHLHNVLIMEDG